MQDQPKSGLKSWWFAGCVGALAALCIFTGKIADERGWYRYWSLIQYGAHCEAVVVRVESAERCFVEYAFSIGGRTYLGTGSNCNVRLGEKRTITYLANDPSHSCLGYAGETLANEVVSFFFGGVSFPSLS